MTPRNASPLLRVNSAMTKEKNNIGRASFYPGPTTSQNPNQPAYQNN